MVKLTLDNGTVEKLRETSQLFDEKGKLLGMFLTAEESYQWLQKTMAYDFEHESKADAKRDYELNGGCTSEEGRQLLEAIRRNWEARQ